VCFFRAPPRIVGTAVQDLTTTSPSVGTRSDPTPRLFWSPILLSDAMRKLAIAANDREVESVDFRRAEDAHSILRIMSNLFSFSHQKTRRVSDQSRPSLEETSNNYALLPTRRSTVFIKDASAFVGFDVRAAHEYIFPAAEPADACKKNIEIARFHGRIDHERVFRMLEVFVLEHGKAESAALGLSHHGLCNPLIATMVEKLCVPYFTFESFFFFHIHNHVLQVC
jgi:WD repeat-containing protein 59